MTQEEVAHLLAVVDLTWPTVPDRNAAPALRVVTWHDYLADASVLEARAAVRVFGLRADPFPPGPAAVAAQVMELRARTAGTQAPPVDTAYAMVMDQVRRVGWYRGEPSWPHPAITATVRALGWDELCHGDVMIVRAHFLRLYESAVREVAASAIATTVALSAGGPILSLDAFLAADDLPPALGTGPTA